ncbi:MAG: nicotinate phosphoribosyltransferase [Polyangiales bacterium]
MAKHAFGLLGAPGRLGLATDLYELTMGAAYVANRMTSIVATFEAFVRKLPHDRGYLIAAGLEQIVEYLVNVSFDGESIDWLRSLEAFRDAPDDFWEWLRAFRFTGDLDAIPEGTVVFANEPFVRVRGPIAEAQLVETFVLATLNHQTSIATKASRVDDAARGKGIIEFGARRAHGFDAAIFGARAAVIGGCVGTSNALAGQAFGLEVYGTAAHSFTMAFAHEVDAFRAYHRAFPRGALLLVDTYDTLEGTRRAVSVGPIRGVRLDSGDLVSLSREVRAILDRADQPRAIILASGDLDEDRLAEIVEAGAPIDLFGVGTELVTSRDAPALGGVYKLVAIDDARGHRPVRKLSPEKATWPDAKQVFRKCDARGRFTVDTIGRATERLEGEALMIPIVRKGVLVADLPTIPAIRERARMQREALSAGVRRRHDPERHPVEISDALRTLAASMHPER